MAKRLSKRAKQRLRGKDKALKNVAYVWAENMYARGEINRDDNMFLHFTNVGKFRFSDEDLCNAHFDSDVALYLLHRAAVNNEAQQER